LTIKGRQDFDTQGAGKSMCGQEIPSVLLVTTMSRVKSNGKEKRMNSGLQ
jgi:hypothetical protein